MKLNEDNSAKLEEPQNHQSKNYKKTNRDSFLEEFLNFKITSAVREGMNIFL